MNALLYPSLNISYTKSNDLLHPTMGQSINFILRGSVKSLLSSASFTQAEIKAKYLYSPTTFAHILLRGDLGYTIVSDLNNLPLSLQFYAGGSDSIRGYADSSIGPGRYLRLGSIEYQNHISGKWSAALFYDVGTASNQWNSKLKRSNGIGVIYNSMIGPIKLYLARALDRQSHPYSIEFSIGPEF